MAILSAPTHLRAGGDLRRLFRFWFVIMFALWLSSMLNLPAQTAVSKEYQIKAAFLFNFAQFVEWPATAFTNAAEPFCIGILGNDPFGAALDETVQGETINNRKIIIERSQRIEDLKNCQMIFISKSEKEHLAEILSQLDSQSVLTVSEFEGFAKRGGGINFYLEKDKVRFEINSTIAQRNGLKISSQLLSLAKIVNPAKENK